MASGATLGGGLSNEDSETKPGEPSAAVNAAETLIAAGDAEGALEVIADHLAGHGSSTALLTLAASAWVTLVDRGSALGRWQPDRREMLLRRLVTQDGCDASPPILHQRIAEQHSAGIAGHLSRQAVALGPTLTALLAKHRPHPRAVLLALLLRDRMAEVDQKRLSDLHRAMFASFDASDLQIPYSVLFDRHHFRRNVEDLREYVRTRGPALIDGSLSLPHILLLYWLVPDAFDLLPSDWPEQALRAALDGRLSADECAAARSLQLRFNIGAGTEDLAQGATDLGKVRAALLAESGTGDTTAVARLEQRPRQLAATLFNELRARSPLVAWRRLRVAICVSGQLRGFRQAWATWRSLLAGIDATIFVHSWTNVGRGTPEPFRSVLPFEGEAFCSDYKRIGAEIGLDELRARYPHLFAVLGQSTIVDEDDVTTLYRTRHVRLDDDMAEPFASFTNSEKMYYKVQRCFEMMAATGEQFDLVVRLRPDKPIRFVGFEWSDMRAALRARPALYCETALGVHYGSILMGDQVAIGLPGTMRVYAETFSRSPPIAALTPYRMEPRLVGHSSVAQLCWFAGLDVRKVPIKFAPFLEAEPLAARLIGSALARDCAGRMDDVDQQLISANRRDIGY